MMEALPKSGSLVAVSDVAKGWLTEKESSEEKEPSGPQIYIAEKMQQYLEEFEN